MATLHATRAIQPDDKIVIDYLSNTDDCSRIKMERCKELKAAYIFDCACTACATRTNEDGNARKTAKKLLDRIDTRRGPKESKTQYIDRRLQDGDAYVTAIRILQLLDAKLAHAYEKLSDAYNEKYKLCLGAANQQRQACRIGQSPKDHLDQAVIAMNRACKAQLICIGDDCPSIQGVRSQALKACANANPMFAITAREPSPPMHQCLWMRSAVKTLSSSWCRAFRAERRVSITHFGTAMLNHV